MSFSADSVAEFKLKISENGLELPNRIDFKCELNDMESPPQTALTLWDEYSRSMVYLKMEWELMNKLSYIKMYPDLIDQNLVAQLEQYPLDHASV